MTHRTTALALSGLLLLGVACDPQEETVPLTSGKVRTSLSDTARTHAHDGAGVITDFVEDGFIDLALEHICSLIQEPAESCSAPELELEDADVDEAIDEIIDTFFADDRVISETATEVIYSVDPADFCGTQDAECIDRVGQLGLQLVVSEPSAGNLDVIVRASGHDALLLELHQDHVSLAADLAEVQAVVADHPGVFDLDASDVPQAAGRVVASLERVNARHYRAELEVAQDIAIQHVTSDGNFEIAIDAATLASVDIDADAESLIATVGVDRVSATLPGAALELFLENPVSGVVHVELGGLTASADLANAEQTLAITGLSLGQTTSSLSLDGVDLLTVDLNQANGRTLDLTIGAGEDELSFTFDPAVVLAVDLFLQPLADAGNEVPAWMLDSDNQASLVSSQGLPSLAWGSDHARIDVGTLELSSSAIASPVTVEAGLCLDGELEDDDVHPFAVISGVVCEQ